MKDYDNANRVQTVVGDFGFSPLSLYSTVLLVCINNNARNSARTIMCVGTGADRRVCLLAARDAPFWQGMTVTTRVKIVSSPKVANAAKKNVRMLKSSRTRTTFHLY